MDNNLQNTQKLAQGLTITPEQQRSLDILQKPSLELQQYASTLVAENPLLEFDETDYNSTPETIGENFDDFDEYSESSTQADTTEQKHNFILNSQTDFTHLGEQLINDARIDAKTPQIANAFEFLVENLDSRGYLPEDILTLASTEGFSNNDTLEALAMLQNSEPLGIGARSLQECFLIQLKGIKLESSLAYSIIENDFELFLKRKVDEIAKRQGRKIADVEKALDIIAKLSPSPAHKYTVEEEKPIFPDVEFFKQDDVWQVRIVENSVPKLRVNPQYRQMIATGTLDSSAIAYVKEKTQEAKSVIDAIKQRQTTLLKISNAILQRQQNFFENGVLAPITRQEISTDCQLHPSTVGRAIAEKNAITPFGVIPLKNFFTTSLETEEGEIISAETIKEKIRNIVDNENSSKPLSDQQISTELEKDGVLLARRTVAKYREEMGIAPKNYRKRF